jgi:dipeptidyl aminopeptidase/acylaminoacyl peptidase
VTASGSGAEKTVGDPAVDTARVRLFDLGAGSSATIAALPTYPFRGDLSIVIAPDLRRIAVMATVGTIAADQRALGGSVDPAWTVEKRLGFVELEPNAPLRWVRGSADSRYPLELYGWSPDSRRVAFRGRPDTRTTTTPLFVADAAQAVATGAGPPGVSAGGDSASSEAWHEPDVLWLDERRLLARLSGSRGDWWLVEADGKGSANLTEDIAAPPSQFRRDSQGALVGLAGDRLLRLSSTASRLEAVSTDPMFASEAMLWPAAGGAPTSSLVVASRAPDGGQRLRQLSAQNGRPLAKPLAIPAKAQLLDSNGESLLWQLPRQDGLFLQRTSFRESRSQDLLTLDRNLGRVQWGRTLLIDYNGLDGQPLKGAVILPPDYTAGRKYPVITWVYAGYQVRNLDDYWLDPYLPAFYNLQLYAAKGYIVLAPSMPLNRAEPKNDMYLELPKGVLPAVDRLVALGLADPDRVGLMGQSRGGYSVYGLVTQTRRFKAAVAMAGFTDLAAMALQFDPAARGYSGIEHEKSDNWWIVGQWGLPPIPSDDYARYWRNSPLAYVDRVETPLLLVHGEYDIRDPIGQADAFFSALYDKGKTARLLRYWGEDHGLSESPANVRNIFEETIRWFDKYLAAEPAAASSGAAAAPRGGG